MSKTQLPTQLNSITLDNIFPVSSKTDNSQSFGSHGNLLNIAEHSRSTISPKQFHAKITHPRLTTPKPIFTAESYGRKTIPETSSIPERSQISDKNTITDKVYFDM